MSVFTSLVTDVLEVPGDPGQTVTIRKLAPKHLDAAAKAAQRQARAELAELRENVALMEQAMQLVEAGARGAGGEAGPASPVAAALADPMRGYDPITLIEHGVIGWTYDRERTRDVFEDLDEERQDWLARAVLKLAKPALFQTAAEQEEARKNG